MSAQLNAILADFRRHRRFADFTHQGMGKDLIEIDIQAIKRRTRGQFDAQGKSWPSLSAAYEEWKRKYFGNRPIGVLHGMMLAIDQLRGLAFISATSMRVTYGTTQQARDEATWFQEGNANQPPRPFYEFDAQGDADKTAYLDHRFDSMTA